MTRLDAKYYCDSMYSELTGLKAHIYNIVRQMDMASEEERKRLGPRAYRSRFPGRLT